MLNSSNRREKNAHIFYDDRFENGTFKFECSEINASTLRCKCKNANVLQKSIENHSIVFINEFK